MSYICIKITTIVKVQKGEESMTVGQLKHQMAELNDNDAIVVTRGNSHPSYKITHIEDATSIGVWEIRIDDFSTDDYWEE